MNDRKRHPARILSIVALCGCLWGQCVYGQYYESREDARGEGRFLTAGAVWSEFRPLSSNSLPDSLASTFDRMMPMIAFHQAGVDLYFGYTTFDDHGESREAIVFGTQVATDIPLLGTRPSTLVLPLVISVDYTKVEAAGPERDSFNIASLGIGVGLKFRTVGPSAEFWFQGLQAVHFSFEGISAGTGSSLATIGEAVLLLPKVPLGEGIVISYRARLQWWSMNDDHFNYRLFYHGPSIGVLF